MRSSTWIRITRLLRALVPCALALPLGAQAQSGCASWNVSGIRTIEQSNGITVTANLRHEADAIRGTATWTQTVTNSRETYARSYDAGVEGTVQGDRFDVVMTWNNGSIGVYVGTIDANGVVAAGTNYDRRRPDIQVRWRNVEPFRCRPPPNRNAAPPTRVTTPKPVTSRTIRKALGTADGGFAKPSPQSAQRDAAPEAPPPIPSRESLRYGDREFLYAVDSHGSVVQHVDRPIGGNGDAAERALERMGTVASGWRDVADVLPAWVGDTMGANSFAMFLLMSDGTLRWVRQDGFTEASGRWAEPVNVGSGWDRYARVFSGGDGIVYAVTHEGALLWFSYVDVPMARTPPRWTGPLEVGTGWNEFVHVFSGGEGIVYAVRRDGTLLWYRHVTYATGVEPLPARIDPDAREKTRTAVWEGPVVVGSGWQQFRAVFSPGNGFIYAMNTNGDLQWYFHAGHRDGTPSWRGPVKRASGWDEYARVFPMMRGRKRGP